MNDKKNFKCKFCDYETDKISNMKSHFEKIKYCDIRIKEKIHQCDILKICMECDEKYSNKKEHKKICKPSPVYISTKKEFNDLLQDTIGKLETCIEEINILKETNKILEEKIKVFEEKKIKEKKELEDIRINSFENSNYLCITENVFNSLLEVPENFIYEFIEKLHFNPNLQENHNIYVSNLTSKRINVFYQNLWKNEDFNIFLKKVINSIEKETTLKRISFNESLLTKFNNYKNIKNINTNKIMNLMYSQNSMIKQSLKEFKNIPSSYDESIFNFKHYEYENETIDNESVNEIYIIQLREFLNSLVYKIGITGRGSEVRLNDYPKGSVLLYSYKVYGNPELEIINLFRLKFDKYIHGKEYFIGDVEEMNKTIKSFLLDNPKYLFSQ